MATKGREVDVIMANKGMERGTRALLVECLERLAIAERGINECVQIQMQTIKTLNTLAEGANGVRQQVEKMQWRPDDSETQ